MQQLTLLKKGRLSWLDVETPVLTSPQQALVRPFVAGRCDGDSLFLFHNYTQAIRLGVAVHFLDPKVLSTFGVHPFRGPIPVGHECIAEVVEIGEQVTSVQVGDKVIVPWAIACGSCPTCQQKLFSHCQTNDHNTLISAYGFGEGTGGWGGMVSDLLRIPYADAMLYKLPVGLNPTHVVSLSDNICDGYRAVGPYLDHGQQSPVLVMGGHAKSIGLYAAGMAVVLGAAQVDYVDDDQERLDIAAKLGANPILVTSKSALFKHNKSFLKDGYPITVDASGSIPRLNFALKSLAYGGVCTSTAFYFQAGTPLPLWDMYTKSATYATGPSHPTRDITKALELIQHKNFKPETVTTVIADWETATESYLEKTTKLILKRAPLTD